MSVDAAEQEAEENMMNYLRHPITCPWRGGEYGSSASNCYAAGVWN